MIERVTRSLTLLRVFVVLSALVLGLGGLALASLVASSIRSQAVEDRQAAVSQYVDGVLGGQGGQGVARRGSGDAERMAVAVRDDACLAAGVLHGGREAP